MSLLRRRMMMQAHQRVAAKYPFMNGKHEFENRSYAEVTNGNHVHLYASKGVHYINISNITQNSEISTDINNINTLPQWFVLTTGDICELHVKNIITSNHVVLFSSNFRRNTSESANFGYGNTVETSEKIIEQVIKEETIITCYFFYIAGYTDTLEIECDIDFFVNGERWI